MNKEVVYKKLIGTKMNDIDLRLAVVLWSYQIVIHCVTFAIEYLGNR